MSIKIEINIQTQYNPTFNLQQFINQVAQCKQINQGQFEFTFIDDQLMQSMHHKHFKDASRTDIITFNLETLENPHGDIYICVNEAARNAQQLNIDIDDEIKTLIVHGILHCLGYNDLTSDEKHNMFKEQDRLLALVKESQ